MVIKTPTTVIIVTYNSEDVLEPCIRSIERDDFTHVTVVDNNSTDGTRDLIDRLQAEDLIDTLIKSPENLGFSKAVNLAFREVSEGTVLLLNPDAILEKGALDILREASNKLPDIGILSPVVYGDANVRTMTAGRQPRIWPLFTHFSGLSRAFPHRPLFRGRHLFLDKHAEKDQYVEWVAGCAMYIPEHTWQSIGVLSERWFMYGEDIEYCKRALDAGFKILVASNSRTYHAMGTSVNKASRAINTMWAQNTYSYYCEVYNPNFLSKTTWRTIFSLGLLSRALIFGLQGVRGNHARSAQARRFLAFSRAVWK